jgi:hypothetical protein
MLRFLADENFNGAVVRGLMRSLPELDVVRVQDERLSGADDTAILEWSAKEGRILLTHDTSTVPPLAHQRVAEGRLMPGVFVARESLPVGRVLEELLVIIECSHDGEWEGQVRYLPL